MQRNRKTIAWERLEMSSRKLEMPREHFMQAGHNKGQKQYGPNKRRRDKEEVARIHRKIVWKGLNDPDNHDSVVTHLEPDIME